MTEKGQYRNMKERKREKVVAEGWCDCCKLYVWGLFVGRAGNNKYLNVLEVYPLVQDIFIGKFSFKIESGFNSVDEGTTRTILYLIGDVNHPDWVIFSKRIHHPEN